jgi:ligand-binding sensor domain-containing protein
VYTTADGLGSDTITRLYEDAGGTLWAFGTGTRAAASRFTAQGWGQVALPELGIEMRAVRAVYHEPDDTFWLATDGAGLLRVQASAVRPFGKADGLPSDAVYALLPDPAGGLWVGTAQGVARVRGERVEPVTNEALRGLAIQAMLRDREGNLWFGGGAGLVMLESAAGAAQRFGPEDGLPDAPVTSLAEDAEGRLWAGTTEGVARRDGAAWSPFAIPNRPAIHPVRQLAAYGERLVLLAAGDAVYDLDPAALQFTRRSSAGLSEITALAAASDGTLYVGTSAGVVRLDPGATRGIRLIGLPEPSAVTALAVSADGALWAGTAGGLRHYVGSEWRTYQGGGAPPARPISALASAADGAVWAAWSGGIARFDDGDWDVWEIGRELPATVGAVRTLASGDRRLAWAGTQSGELLRYGNGAWTVLPAPPGPAAAVLALAGGPGNVLWVGRADGVARLEAGRWAVVTAGDGLGGARVAALIARPDGSVWFATENGLARWSPES